MNRELKNVLNWPINNRSGLLVAHFDARATLLDRWEEEQERGGEEARRRGGKKERRRGGEEEEEVEGEGRVRIAQCYQRHYIGRTQFSSAQSRVDRLRPGCAATEKVAVATSSAAHRRHPAAKFLPANIIVLGEISLKVPPQLRLPK